MQIHKAFGFLVRSKRTGDIAQSSNLITIAFTYFCYFGLLGIFAPYMGVFLDFRGFNSVQIGTMLGYVALARVLGPVLWANIADKTGKVGETLRLGCLLSLVAFAGIFSTNNYYLLTITLCLMMMFWTAVLPQLEVTSVKAMEKSGHYGKLRLWGSIGFIACSVIVGKLIDTFDPNIVLLCTLLVLILLYAGSMLLITPQRKLDSSVAKSSDWRRVARPLFIIFLLANTFLQISFGTYYSFFPLYLIDLGYSGLMTGLFVSIGVCAEILIFVYASRLLGRFSILGLLAFSILLTVLRWFVLAYYASNLALLSISQLIHAFSFGLTHVASVYFLSQYFSAQFQSRAQALYVSIAFGIGGALGSVIAGHMWDSGSGAKLSFSFSALMAFVGLLLLIIAIITRMDKRFINRQKV